MSTTHFGPPTAYLHPQMPILTTRIIGARHALSPIHDTATDVDTPLPDKAAKKEDPAQ